MLCCNRSARLLDGRLRENIRVLKWAHKEPDLHAFLTSDCSTCDFSVSDTLYLRIRKLEVVLLVHTINPTSQRRSVYFLTLLDSQIWTNSFSAHVSEKETWSLPKKTLWKFHKKKVTHVDPWSHRRHLASAAATCCKNTPLPWLTRHATCTVWWETLRCCHGTNRTLLTEPTMISITQHASPIRSNTSIC